MTATTNTATALAGNKPRRTRKAPEKTTTTGTTLALVDGSRTTAVADKVDETVRVAEKAPQVEVTQKPTEAVKVAEKPVQAPKVKAPAKPKLEATAADLKRLVYVPDSQGDKAKTRHLSSCPAYFDARWDNATTFTKVTDAKRLAGLKPCRACATRAATERTAK